MGDIRTPLGSHPVSYERALAASERARALLSSYPNVVSVGVGTNERRGSPTDDWCISVLVRVKRRPVDLPSDGMVPREIDGVPTDIVEVGDFGALFIDPKDKSECYDFATYRPLRGGVKVSTTWPSTAGIQSDTTGFGTLGCVAIMNDAPRRHVALTNRHVVEHVLPHGLVGQAHPDTGSSCCGSTEMIGNVLAVPEDAFNRPGGNVFKVDAALIALTDGLKWIAGLAGVGRGLPSPFDPIAGIRSLRPPAPVPQNLPVKKRGARTGPTLGHVANPQTGNALVVDGHPFTGLPITNPPYSAYYVALPVMTVHPHGGEASVNITGATRARPCQITAPGHTFFDDQIVYVKGITGMEELNGKG
jgi:hypothetical protein